MPNFFFKAQCACEPGPLPVSCARARQYQTPVAVFLRTDEFLWSVWKQEGATVVRTRSKNSKRLGTHHRRRAAAASDMYGGGLLLAT